MDRNKDKRTSNRKATKKRTTIETVAQRSSQLVKRH